VQRIAERWRDVVITSNASDEPSSSMEHSLKTPNDMSGNSVEDSIAVVNPTYDEGLHDGSKSINCQ
jgi:hypothetical protein